MTKAPQKKAPAKKADASLRDPHHLATEMPISEKDEVKKAEDQTNPVTKKGA